IGTPHLFPTLVTVVNPLAWIGGVLVVGRIVVAKFDVQPGALRYPQGSSVSQLPIEVIVPNVEHDFFSSVRIRQLVLHACGTHMRVGPEPYEIEILEER